MQGIRPKGTRDKFSPTDIGYRLRAAIENT